MKKVFELPEIEIVKFETEDVLSNNMFDSWESGGNDIGWEE